MVIDRGIVAFETDLPLSAASEWPADVVQARHLLEFGEAARKGEHDSYWRTGDVKRSDEVACATFLVFAA
jgi:hypothetical protein